MKNLQHIVDKHELDTRLDAIRDVLVDVGLGIGGDNQFCVVNRRSSWRRDSLFMPALCAARLGRQRRVFSREGESHIFSFRPPTGKTCPSSEISPVIATSGSTFVFVKSDTKAVRMAVPALGPSLPIAPSGLRISERDRSSATAPTHI